MKIEEAKNGIGQKVAYKKGLEYGIITSVNNTFAFVKYGSDAGSKATYPNDLEFDK